MRVYLLLLLTAMIGTALLVPVVRSLVFRTGILKPLRERDVHVKPIPRMGGLAMIGGMFLAVLLGSSMPYLAAVFDRTEVWVILAGATAMAILGAVDDVVELDWVAKLAGQVLIAGGMAMSGIQLLSFPIFGLTIGSSRLSVVVSVLVMVTITNAVNFIDGLDGLAAGVVAIGAIGFFAYAYLLTRVTQAPTYATTGAAVSIILAGVCLGFLWFNYHPASIFMGDSGALILGLVMSAAGIVVTGQVNPEMWGSRTLAAGVLPVLLPLAVMAIPLADLLITAVGRMLQGKSPFHADRTHLHDRLLDYGHSHRGVVQLLWAWTALVSAVGVGFLLFPAWHVLIGAVIGVAVLSWASRAIHVDRPQHAARGDQS